MRWIELGIVVCSLSLAGCPDDTTTPQGDSGSGTDDGGSTAPSIGTDSLSGTSAGSTGADSSTGAPPTATSGSEGDATGSSSGSTGAGTTGSTGDATTGSTGAESSSDGSSTGSSTGEESSTGEATTGVVFIQMPDLPPVECDLFDQDCPGGEKCMPYGVDGATWNAIGCFPIDMMTVAVGDVCSVEESATSGVDNCEEGVMCWDVDTETLEGVCVAMCTGSANNPICADASTTCAQANDGLINLCLPNCDPILQDCDEGLGCYPIGDGFVCAPDASGEDGAAGDPCEFINVCDPALTCVAGDTYGDACASFNCCTPFCDTSDVIDGCPEPEQECLPFFEEGQEPPGLEDVGVCGVPA